MAALGGDLHAALESVLTGPLAPFRGRLCFGPPDAAVLPVHSVPVDALMTPEHLQQVCGHFDAKHGATPARVVASIWSKWHFAIVMPAWFIGHVLLGRRLPMALGALRFDMDGEGRTLGLRLPDGGERIGGAADAERAMSELMDQHLTPFIAQLAERTGVTHRVLWSNAGNLFEAFIRRLDETHPGLDGLAQARRWLETEVDARGQPNPMFQPVLYLPRAEDLHRMRRICCMRYLVPDRVFCTTCPSPLLEAENKACKPPEANP
ncbi:siderophore-iron reductase FhuF [Variovorax boronicumulans]|uniref:siderophore-iron reductase FhuF n=1 Tax=Variovorax boronicumulans TaxID=436515 RepID=UPI001C57CDE7